MRSTKHISNMRSDASQIPETSSHLRTSGSMNRDIEKRIGQAIKLFWLTRDKQSESQGAKTGQKDAGLRAAVTGGKHLDGFTEICRDLFIQGGVPEAHVFWKKRKELPGFYRAEKNWDL